MRPGLPVEMISTTFQSRASLEQTSHKCLLRLPPLAGAGGAGGALAWLGPGLTQYSDANLRRASPCVAGLSVRLEF
jgi:hypothetical protein